MLLPVKEALTRVLSAAKTTDIIETPLHDADGMVLASDKIATRNQPPFAASAMDGYAVRYDDLSLNQTLTIIGEAAAGHGFGGEIGKGEATRIFTGAALPDGADTILIQEDAVREGDAITPVSYTHLTLPTIYSV